MSELHLLERAVFLIKLHSFLRRRILIIIVVSTLAHSPVCFNCAKGRAVVVVVVDGRDFVTLMHTTHSSQQQPF